MQAGLQRSESEGQRRMLELNARQQGRPRDLPQPVGRRRPGARRRRHRAGRQPQQVADRIEEYAALGIEEFVLSGYPHLEEAYWFGEGVLPELAAAACGSTRPRPRRPRRCRSAAGVEASSMTVTPSRPTRTSTPRELREAFGVFPSGVVAVAADVDGQRSGWPPARSPR